MYRDVPCIQDRLLSLAYCQEPMRRLCNLDDIVFGFGSIAEKNNGKLLFCAKIDTIIESPYYYKLYKDRRDCVYHYNDKNNTIKFVANRDFEYFEKRYHTNIGYKLEKARVILSKQDNFRTFFKYNDANKCLKKYPDIIEYMMNKTRGAYCDQPIKYQFHKLFDDIMNCSEYKYEENANEYDPKTSKPSKLNAMIPKRN